MCSAFSKTLSRCALGLGILLAFAQPGKAQTTLGASVNESNVQVTYYLATNGNDSNNGLSSGAAFATLNKAVTTAMNGPLSSGQKTKISIADGNYSSGLFFSWGSVWPGSSRDTPLIIEGSGTNGPNFTSGILISNKAQLVIRNITVTGGGDASLGDIGASVCINGSDYHDYSITNILLDRINTVNSKGKGVMIYNCHHATINKCSAKNGQDEGMSMIGRWNVSQDCVVDSNDLGGDATDGRGGFYLIGQDCKIDNLTATNNHGSGLRQDFQSKNVTISNSRCNNNYGVGANGKGNARDANGMVFEISEGPTTITNCEMSGNTGAGLFIHTAHNITADTCKIQNNAITQVEINGVINRGDGVVYDDSGWKGGWTSDNKPAFNRTISNAEAITVKNSTVTTNKGADSHIYWNENNNYVEFLQTGQFTGANNLYYNDQNEKAFLGYPYNSSQEWFYNFTDWKGISGTDSTSRWGAPDTGTGLKASYYSDKNLTTLVKTQTDPQINFNWGNGKPNNTDGTAMSSINADNFSIRWEGQIQAIEAGTYTFTTITDDGVRLWLNGNKVIDKWNIQSPTSYSTTLWNGASQKIPVKMEYFEATGGASAQLFWTRPSATQSVIVPQAQLYTQISTRGPNLILNPGFESRTDAWVAWTPNYWDSFITESTNGVHSGTLHGTHWRNTAYSFTTYQTFSNLTNGSYTLRCYARALSSPSASTLYASNFGGTKISKTIPYDSNYQLVEITGINVTNGKCEVGIWTDAPANQGAYFDDFDFFKE